jgi:hypothetical protein
LLLARRVGRGLRWSQCKFFPLLRRCKRVVSVPAPLRKGGTPCHPRWMFWLRCCWWRHLLVLVAGPSGGGGGSPFPSFPCSVGDRFSFNVFDSSRWVLWAMALVAFPRLGADLQDGRWSSPCSDARRCWRRAGARTSKEGSGLGCNSLIFQGP